MKQFIIVAAVATLFLHCGLSKKEMETAKKHFATVAESQCKCKQIKAKKDAQPNEYGECVAMLERNTRYMTMFFDVVKPSASERKEAAKAGDEIRANCQ
jgi:hypothetical protein